MSKCIRRLTTKLDLLIEMLEMIKEGEAEERYIFLEQGWSLDLFKIGK